MKVSILIVSWNTRQLLLNCLQSIYAYPPQIDFEIWIVDNASIDGSAQAVRECFPQVQVVDSPTNLGFAGGNNLAVQHAQGQYLLLLNPDTIVHPQAIDQLVAFLDATLDAGAVGPRMLNSDGSLQISTQRTPTLFLEAWRLFHLDHFYPLSYYRVIQPRTQLVDDLAGSCILIRGDVYRSLGGFDENFFVYSEEVDLCLRVRKAGWKIYYFPDPRITHFGGQSTCQVQDEMFLELYRNKVRFFRKHYGSSQTEVYKMLIFLASHTRVLPVALLGKLQSAFGQKLVETARQYRLLLAQLWKF